MDSFWERNIVNNHFLLTLLFVGAVFFLWEVQSIVVSLFLAYIFMAALSPAVEFLVGKGAKRGLAVLTVYFLAVVGVLAVIAPVVPFLLNQIQELAQGFPYFLTRAGQILGYSVEAKDLTAVLQSELDLLGRNTLTISKKVFSGFFSTVTTMVLGLYFLLDKKRLQGGLANLWGEDRDKILGIVRQVDKRLGAWVRGQLALCLAVGAATFLGLSILGLPFAFPLAIVAGILEIIPIIGPIVSAVPAIVVALTVSPVLALAVVGLYIVVQLLENNLLVPKIMQQAVGLNPVAIIVGIMVGGKLLGVIGSLLAIPAILVISVVIGSLRK